MRMKEENKDEGLVDDGKSETRARGRGDEGRKELVIR